MTTPAMQKLPSYPINELKPVQQPFNGFRPKWKAGDTISEGFRSDNGNGEYNKTFRGILAVRGIAFEPYATQDWHHGKDDRSLNPEGQGHDA
jgi:hypothetical protein